MKKRIFVGLLAALAFTFHGFAAGFNKTTAYADGTFTDVPDSEWYASEVKSAYELGFMNGVGGSLFSPDGNVTVAEAVTMAARVHASYNGTEISKDVPGEWYAPYVKYAVDNKMISENRFDEYDRPITRAEMAEVFYASVPQDYLKPVNAVDYLPDINEKADYREQVLALYKAGVVMGNDAYGSFYPNNPIIRCEAAAIINRIALPENRLQKTLQKREDPTPAVYFIDDSGALSATTYGAYGWEFDSRGVPAGQAASRIQVLDTSKTERTAMLRQFAEQNSGKIVMETNLLLQSANNGFYINLGKGEETLAMSFVTKDGKFFAKEAGKLTDTGLAVADRMTVKTITDLKAKTNTLIADGKFIGTYAFADMAASSVDTLAFSSDKESEVVADVSKTKLYSGYALNDIFMSSGEREGLPYNYTLTDSTAKLVSLASNAYDAYSAEISTAAGKTGVLTTSFDPISRKVVFEIKFYMTDYNDGTSFAITSNGTELAKIVTKGKEFYTGDGTLLRAYNSGVWQTLRIEANTDTGVLSYSVNHKKLASGVFTADAIDGIKITMPAQKDTSIVLDDLFVCNSFDEQPDYVPEPKAVASDDTIVGIEVCDIWRNGFQFGWDYTSAYDELYPYLGMFDEGSTEVADWETKWLIEHGVDFKLICWYSGTPSAPVKTPRNSFALSAQLDSKYTDSMKYAIMWENSANLPSNSEQFRKNIVDYWKEYYLYDKDRYFTIDNKPLITIYRTETLMNIFKSEEAVKAEIDYLRQTCVDLGYDGAIILVCNGTNDQIKRMGFDGRYAYNWGQNAFDPEFQKTKLTTQDEETKAAGITSVPTVGVGFCNMFLGQGNSRSPLITKEDYTNLLKWVKDDFLAKRTGEPWQTEMLILSNWNEFGEGHYILPTNRMGFDYLDAISDAFTKQSEHTDLRPDDDTRTRYNALYNQSFKRIRRYELADEKGVDLDDLTVTLSYDFTKSDTEQIFRNSHGNEFVEYTSSGLHGKSNGADFAIITTKDININAADAEYLRIIYKATAETEKVKGQIFFITESDQAWNEKKNINFDITADGEYHEYLVNLSACSTWSGLIKRLRIDPIERGNCEYEIQLVELLDAPTGYEIYLNAEVAPTPVTFQPVLENGALFAAIDPYAASFYAKLGIFYRWDFDKKELSLYGADDTYIIFTMDSDKAQTDKGVVSLKGKATLMDGIPMIEIDAMAKALGLKLTVDGNKYTLLHHDASGERDDANLDMVWDFSIDGYLDGFTIACAEVTEHKGGVVSFKSLSNGRRHDPVLNSPNIVLPAVKYEKVIVRMAYDVTGGVAEGVDEITSSLFFAPPSGSFNGNDVVQIKTKGLSSNGKFIDLEFDMTENVNWTSTIGKIRFDPFEAEGTFSIDSIKILLTNPDGVIRVVEKPKEIVWNAGEELVKGARYNVGNGKMTVIADPDDENVKVFEIKTTASDRKWTYFNIFMNFEPGKTYTISYRIYPLKDFHNNGYDKNTIGGNFIYGSDGETVSNHVIGSINTPDDAGWTEVTAEYTVDGAYKPSNKDCFQFWSNPVNNCGVSYLVSDIRIELKD